MVLTAWELGKAEEDLAEAALDPLKWGAALTSVTALTKSFGAILLPCDNNALPNVPLTESLIGSAERYFKDGWHLRDERTRGIHHMLKCGIVDDFDIFDEGTIARHPYYQEFLAPHGLQWFAGIRMACGRDTWCLSIQRTIAQGPFSKSEKVRLARLSERLSSCAAIARALGAATLVGLIEAFEASGTAIALVDRLGDIFRINQAAERILVDEVRIERRTLVTSDTNANAALSRALRDLLWGSKGGLSAPVVLPRGGRRPILAYPVRFSSMTANALADCQAVVIFVDPDARRKPGLDLLRSTFAFSAAEARLCGQLATGQSIECAADGLEIAKETARSQLKSIFDKAGVNRQAELVALLGALSPFVGFTQTGHDRALLKK